MKILADAKMIDGRLKVNIDIVAPESGIELEEKRGGGKPGGKPGRGGPGRWVTINGNHVYIDRVGVVREGPNKPPVPWANEGGSQKPEPKKPEPKKPEPTASKPSDSFGGKVKVKKGDAQAEKVLGEIASEHPELAAALAATKKPVTVGMVVAKKMPRHVALANGVYQPATNTVLVNTTAWGLTDKGQQFVPGKTTNISGTGKDKNGQMKATMIHELAHHISETGGAKVNEVMRQQWVRTRAKDKHVTQYASTHPEENFAEMMAAYTLHPKQFKQFDPEGYAAIASVFAGFGG